LLDSLLQEVLDVNQNVGKRFINRIFEC